MANEYLAVTGSLCLISGLIEAWLLVIVFSNPGGKLAQWIPGSQDLLKSHIDYLMMALLLFAFYLLFKHFEIQASTLLIFSMCLGSLGNPGLFLIRALKPSLKESPTPSFRLGMLSSCLLTTIGYLGAAIGIMVSAIKML